MALPCILTNNRKWRYIRELFIVLMTDFTLDKIHLCPHTGCIFCNLNFSIVTLWAVLLVVAAPPPWEKTKGVWRHLPRKIKEGKKILMQEIVEGKAKPQFNHNICKLWIDAWKRAGSTTSAQWARLFNTIQKFVNPAVKLVWWHPY